MTRPSDLPPGCSPFSIPGNRPGDDDDERFFDALDPLARKLSVDIGDLPSDVQAVLLAARDLGYDRGFADGRAEGEIDAAEKFAPPDDEPYPPAPRPFDYLRFQGSPFGERR